MVNTMQQVGGSIGTALLSTLVASAVTACSRASRRRRGWWPQAAVHGYTVAFWVAAAIFAAGAVVVGATMRSVRIEPAPEAIAA